MSKVEYLIFEFDIPSVKGYTGEEVDAMIRFASLNGRMISGEENYNYNRLITMYI
jgi:hypothetical protein